MKKMMFYELAEGHFAAEVQQDFEEAQALAHARGVPIKLSVELTIHPESRTKRGTGLIKFKCNLKQPARESIEFITEMSKEGQIIDSGHRQGAMHLEGGK